MASGWRWTALFVLATSVGCARANPAFDEAELGEASKGTADASSGDASVGATSGRVDTGTDAGVIETTSGPGTDPTTDTDTDPTDPSAGTDGTDATDTMDMVCTSWDGKCQLFMADSCANEHKCAPVEVNGTWSARCVPVEADAGIAGDVCAHFCGVHGGADDCGAGLTCWFGECAEMCELSQTQCRDKTQQCVEPGSGATGFGLCAAECDPLGQDCGPDQVCVGTPGGNFICVPDASGGGGGQGDGCEFTNDCGPGLMCADGEDLGGDCADQGCCTALCSTNNPMCPAGYSCIPFLNPSAGYPDTGLCFPA